MNIKRNKDCLTLPEFVNELNKRVSNLEKKNNIIITVTR